MVSTTAGETHAPLAISQQQFTDVHLSLDMETTQQLRTDSVPNSWEVGWVLWDYVDNTHFYYAALKPNGLEIGKADPAYPGAQRFLVTLETPTFAVGTTHHIDIRQTHDAASTSLTVSVDGGALASFTDTQRPYASGAVGLYTADARVAFDNVLATGTGGASIADDFEAYPAQMITRDGATLGPWTFPFLGFGSAEVASFGAAPPPPPPGGVAVAGSAAADALLGGAGADTIAGLGGADTITGGAGDDVLSGGAGADRFVFRPGFGHDHITDFAAGRAAGHDVVRLEGIAGVAGFRKFLANTVDTPDGAVFTAPRTQDTITFDGVAKAALVWADFMFA
jgi:hypothetical protein